MIVTNLNYFLSGPKIQTLDWFCSRVSGERKFQNVIGTDGMEGYGKSTITSADAYYMAFRLRRPLKLFFDIDALNNYSLSSKDEILIWDDVALSGLTLEGYNQQIVKLIKILLLARKKRHTYFLNIQEVFRMKEPLVARMVGMNHVYSPDGLSLGNYCYYNEKQVRFMYHVWATKKRKMYKYYSYKARFPNVLYKIFDEKEYEDLKDQAIQSIQETKKPIRINKNLLNKEKKLDILQKKIGSLAVETGSVPKMAEYLNINQDTLYSWANKPEKGADASVSEAVKGDKYNIARYIEPKNKDYLKMVVPTKILLPKPKKDLEAFEY